MPQLARIAQEPGPRIGPMPPTRLQAAAYDAQWAAALPTSELGRTLLVGVDGIIPVQCCRTYLEAVRAAPWFAAAFGPHASMPLTIVGGRGSSAADRETGRVKIGTGDRRTVQRCEQMCLHELAHIVTPDHGPDGTVREPPDAPDQSRGHHRAWRANFVLIVTMQLGRPAGSRLRLEFRQWGLPA